MPHKVGHFLAKNPWLSYHELLTEKTAKLVGAFQSEDAWRNRFLSMVQGPHADTPRGS